MCNIIYTEYLKLKRMYVFLLPIIAAVVYQIFNCLSWLKNMSGQILNDDYVKNYQEAFFTNKCTITYLFLFFIMFSVLSGYIFLRTFRQNGKYRIFLFYKQSKNSPCKSNNNGINYCFKLLY